MAVSKVRTKDSEFSGVTMTWLVKCHELSPIKRVCVRVICSRLVHPCACPSLKEESSGLQPKAMSEYFRVNYPPRFL